MNGLNKKWIKRWIKKAVNKLYNKWNKTMNGLIKLSLDHTINKLYT